MYVGIDVGKTSCAICAVDAQGVERWKCEIATGVEDLAAILAEAPRLQVIALETGAFSRDLCLGLKAKGLNAILVDARHAAPFLREIKANKTDANDAYALAQLVRMGGHREGWVRSNASVERLLLLQVRSNLIRAEIDLRNALMGQISARGIRFRARSRKSYLDKFHAVLNGELKNPILNQLLETLVYLDQRLDGLDRQIKESAKSCPVCVRLMTIPSIGPITALWFTAVIDDPRRFRRSRDVGPYLGLVPRVRQSGIRRRSGRISGNGSVELRSCLFNAARNLRFVSKTPCRLRQWTMAVEERRGANRALTALSRKLAIVMHSIWINETTFDSGRCLP